MIDEKKLIEEIECDFCSDCVKCGGSCRFADIKEIINKQPKVGEWIPVEEHIPDDDRYVLMSFANFTVPMIGRYQRDKDDGGNWYLGDCDEEDTCLANDLFVNAWMPLPAPYDMRKKVEE